MPQIEYDYITSVIMYLSKVFMSGKVDQHFRGANKLLYTSLK